jgi:hypothetical protein
MDLLAGQRGANLRRLLLPDVEIQIDVENRDYQFLSQSEIGGGKRIYQHLSGPNRSGPAAKPSFRLSDSPGLSTGRDIKA